MEIEDKLYRDIENYCRLNTIPDVWKFINGLLKKAFMIEKYGEKPEMFTVPPQPVTVTVVTEEVPKKRGRKPKAEEPTEKPVRKTRKKAVPKEEVPETLTETAETAAETPTLSEPEKETKKRTIKIKL